MLSESSSPSLSRIVSHVAALKRGGPGARTAPLQTFSILESEYAQLDDCLKEADLYGFYHDKVRNDYDPSLGHLIIRMPTNRHVILIQRFIELVLAKITARPSVLSKIIQPSTWSSLATIIFGHKSPDVSIGYLDQVYPQIVFEVAYNQDRRALKRLAWEYIIGSSHCIRCVIGLTSDYLQNNLPFSSSPTHDASVSVWHPLVEIKDKIKNMDAKQDIKDQRLRECNPDHSIAVLSLRDLLDDETLKEEATAPNIDFKIVITSGEMIDILMSAELCLERSRRQLEHLLLESQKPNCIWRKRRSTPDEDKRIIEHSNRWLNCKDPTTVSWITSSFKWPQQMGNALDYRQSQIPMFLAAILGS